MWWEVIEIDARDCCYFLVGSASNGFDRGRTSSSEVCEMAASNGHADCLAFAHQRDYEWDEKTCGAAAREGHLESLRYAHENGCSLDRGCFMCGFDGFDNCSYSIYN